MTTDDYVPNKDADLIPWAANMNQNIDAYAKDLGLTGEDTGQVKEACTDIEDEIKKNAQVQAAAKKATAEKVAGVHKHVDLIRTVVRKAKTSAGYTPAIGKALGWIGSDDPIDPTTYKPKLSATVFPGHVTVNFTKNKVQGVNIYSQLKGEETWEKLAFDSYSPYEDNRPLQVPGVPEIRLYRAAGVVHDHEIGQMSDIIEVTFGG